MVTVSNLHKKPNNPSIYTRVDSVLDHFYEILCKTTTSYVGHGQ